MRYKTECGRKRLQYKELRPDTDKSGAGKTEMRKRILLTIMLGGLLSLLYITIFSLSAQDANVSGDLSMRFTKQWVGAVTEISGKAENESVIGEIAALYEGLVRKLAHFAEYTVMGALVCLLLAVWFVRNRRRMILNVGWVFVSAALDEIHQVFVPGRHGSFSDVLLDTIGGIFGMVLVFFLCEVQFRGKQKMVKGNRLPCRKNQK